MQLACGWELQWILQADQFWCGIDAVNDFVVDAGVDAGVASVDVGGG